MSDRTAQKGSELTLKNGKIIASLSELATAIDAMESEEFAEYVNTQHIFADWIDFCLNDKFLATTVRRATTKEEMHKALFIALFR